MKTEAQKRADVKYKHKTYDQINFRVRKDSEINADSIRRHAEEKGESLNEYILKAIQQRIDRGE